MNKLDLQRVINTPDQPRQQQFQHWLDSALKQQSGDTETVIRIVNIDESKQLNQRYRQQNKPTNVLSFPFEAPPGIRIDLLGDLVICAPIMATEAEQQKKTAEAHWAHIVIHGVLHLLGFDHMEDEDAHRMETEEIKILHTLGFANPYTTENYTT